MLCSLHNDDEQLPRQIILFVREYNTTAIRCQAKSSLFFNIVNVYENFSMQKVPQTACFRHFFKILKKMLDISLELAYFSDKIIIELVTEVCT